MSYFAVFIILQMLLVGSLSQQFDVFKSYKDAAVKPKNYGRKIKRTHDVEEYLDETQLKMLRARKSAVTDPANVMTDQWSGFEVNKKLRNKKLNNQQAVSDRFQTERRLKSGVDIINPGKSWINSVISRFEGFSTQNPTFSNSQSSGWNKGVVGLLSLVIFVSLSILVMVGAIFFRAKDLIATQPTEVFRSEEDNAIPNVSCLTTQDSHNMEETV